MKEQRSASQILFGFLPEQTVDLQGRIWKVREWRQPLVQPVDHASLRAALIRVSGPWAAAGRDGDYARDLRQGRDFVVHSLSRENGVSVDPFPEIWMCKACHRVATSTLSPCRCGQRRFGQLPFVHYHGECGALRAPFVPRCPQHDDVRVRLPGTASAAEIRFECPQCNRVLRQGLGFPNCQCGQGQMATNVHRASSVYTARTVVIVNPPSPEKVRRLTAAGGPDRALSWILDGMSTARVEDVALSRGGLLQQLLDSGLDPTIAEAMVRQAETAGAVGPANQVIDLPTTSLAPAQADAVTVALALSESRLRHRDLVDGTDEWSELGILYRDKYPAAVDQSRLEAVELVDSFPVLTANFGYTRGQASPGASRLVPFRDRRGNYVVYGDMAKTEALFVRLDPVRVARWIEGRGFPLRPWSDARSARLAILAASEVPPPGANPGPQTVGSSVLTLVHSYSHRLIRRAAVIAGIERSALSELLVPLHLGFFVYAAARGDFVLGGLQAVFETELDKLLNDLVSADHRCALDPGCKRGGGACVACLHLGEPSCRYFNAFLDRGTLSGVDGFLRSSSA